MIGFNGSSGVFRYTWNVDGNTNGNSLDALLYDGSQSQMSANYGNQQTSNLAYNPSKMTTITVTLDGSAADSLVYAAEGLTSVSTDALNDNTSLTSIRWGITNDTDAAGFWLDNVSITPEPSTFALAGVGLLGLRRRRRS